MKLRYFSRILLCLVCVSSAAADFRILAFGDSNTWGWKPDGSGTRFADDVRWSGVLESRLGAGYTVITDGLVARRTDLDGMDAGLVEGVFLNGAKTLPAALARNAPIDLVLIFLGTNDLQSGAERSAAEVAAAAAGLADLVGDCQKLLYSSYPAPPVVWLVVPPPLGDLSASPLKGLFSVGKSESAQLGAAFESMSQVTGHKIFDLNRIYPGSTGADGIHLTEAAHAALGIALTEAIEAMD